MWQENAQAYNRLVWKNEENNASLKHILTQDMSISMRLLYSLKKNEVVKVNSLFLKNHDMVKKGDIIEVSLEDEENDYAAQPMDIKALYEDEDLYVIEKPPFMVVHPTKGHQSDTLANGLIYFFKKNNIRSKIRFVNRLDRDTSGILIVAKNSYCHSVLTKDDAMHSMKKTYIAVVEGHISNDEGTLDLPIGRAQDGIKRIVDDEGQRAVTHYKVLKHLSDASLVEISLETGRTHQIRVHFSHIGHPLMGDDLYGGDMEHIQRQALHCSELEFLSPRKEHKDTVKSELPQDMRELIEKLSLIDIKL